MSSLANINTVDPIALRSLMTETIFGMDGVMRPKQTPHFSFYGENKRNYLFLTLEKQHEWMSAAALDAFTKTLAALKLAPDDVAVLNLARLPEIPLVADLSAFFSPKVVVSLGAPFAWPEQAGTTVFVAHSFDEMLADAEKKRVFWTTIKNLLV